MFLKLEYIVEITKNQAFNKVSHHLKFTKKVIPLNLFLKHLNVTKKFYKLLFLPF